MKLKITLAACLAGTMMMATAPEALAQANCADKGGRGWGSTTESARFQAWEAVLQGTDWGMWAAWITGGAKVGTAASGYKVSNVREKCENDKGGGKVCLMRAKLCK